MPRAKTGQVPPKPASQAKIGRPCKLTPEIQQDIVASIRLGNYIETAAATAGISKNTLYDWLKRGARERQRLEANPRRRPLHSEAPFLAFSDAIESVRATAEADMVKIVTNAAAKGDWTAAMTRLERMYPDRWGKRRVVEMSGPNGKPLSLDAQVNSTVTVARFDYSKLSDEQLRQLQTLLKVATVAGVGTDEDDDQEDSDAYGDA